MIDIIDFFGLLQSAKLNQPIPAYFTIDAMFGGWKRCYTFDPVKEKLEIENIANFLLVGAG